MKRALDNLLKDALANIAFYHRFNLSSNLQRKKKKFTKINCYQESFNHLIDHSLVFINTTKRNGRQLHY